MAETVSNQTGSAWGEFWRQMDTIKATGDSLLAKLRKRRNGWKLKEPKPDGTLVAERSERETYSEDDGRWLVVRQYALVTGKTCEELFQAVAKVDGICPSCTHPLKLCGADGCKAVMRNLPKVGVTIKGKEKKRHPFCGCGAHRQGSAT